MADVTINYEGNAIATMSASGTKTLLTAGKYCDDDIEVVYVSPGGGGSVGTVTINSEPTNLESAYNAVLSAIGGTATKWIAWVDYSAAYYENSNSNVACIVGAATTAQAEMWRTDSSYSNFRKFGVGSSTSCTVPAGTVFNYVIIN